MPTEPSPIKLAQLGKVSLDAAMPQVYDELHRLASAYMRRERAGHTLQPTALVNETYMRLLSQRTVDFENRAHVLGVAAQMMRRILRTHQEKRTAAKRGGDATVISLSDSQDPAAATQLDFVELDEVLTRLEALDARQAKVAELKIFGGLSMEEIAVFLGISPATAHRDWVSGRLWLMGELRPA